MAQSFQVSKSLHHPPKQNKQKILQLIKGQSKNIAGKTKWEKNSYHNYDNGLIQFKLTSQKIIPKRLSKGIQLIIY